MGQAALAETPEDYFQTDIPVGEILRRSRLYYGQSLQDVERNLRIRASQLDAIEKMEYDKLPGRVYAIGFVRSYAEYLGLDGGQVVALFKVQFSHAQSQPELQFPATAKESKLPSIKMVAGSIVLAVLCIALWQFWIAQNTYFSKEIPELNAQYSLNGFSNQESEALKIFGPPRFEDFQSMSQNSALSSYSEHNAMKDQGGANDIADINASRTIWSVSNIQKDAVKDAIPDDAILDKEAPQNTPSLSSLKNPNQISPENKAISGPYSNDIRLNITKNSWVEIRDAQGEVLVSKKLKQGDQYLVPSRPDLTMDLGNAGGVFLMLDETNMISFGTEGQVRKNIPLDISQLMETFSLSINSQHKKPEE